MPTIRITDRIFKCIPGSCQYSLCFKGLLSVFELTFYAMILHLITIITLNLGFVWSFNRTCRMALLAFLRRQQPSKYTCSRMNKKSVRRKHRTVLEVHSMHMLRSSRNSKNGVHYSLSDLNKSTKRERRPNDCPIYDLEIY